MNKRLLKQATQEKVELGKKVRIDSTVTESMMHAPTDSSFLLDNVRVMVRLLKQFREMDGAPPIEFCNHQRVAKKGARAIVYTRGADKKAKIYAGLLMVTQKTIGYLEQAQRISEATPALEWKFWNAGVNHYKPVIKRIIDQTHRRIEEGENAPADEKLFSIFETHTDIIIKGSRDIQYGHKLNLSSGKSGLILDIVIERKIWDTTKHGTLMC